MKKGCKYCKKNKFSPEEDTVLRSLVNKLGESNWEEIAKLMPNRNSRQCHDRWIYYISPEVNTNAWTKSEEQYLIRCILEHGRKWTQISKLFPGRNDIQIKNKWNTLKKTLTEDSIITKPKKTVKKAKICKEKNQKEKPVEESKECEHVPNDIDLSFIDEIFSRNIDIYPNFF